jgi:hypothetical protein
LKKYQES